MSRLFHVLASLRSLFHSKQKLRIKAGLFALLFIILSLVSVMPASIVAAEPVDCARNPDSADCTNTKEKCEAKNLYWYNDTCNTADNLNSVDLPASTGWTLSKSVEATMYARALLNCMTSALNSAQTLKMSEVSSLNSQGWKDLLNGDGARGSLLDSEDDGVYNCENENNWIEDAKEILQFDTNTELLCTLGWYRVEGEANNTRSTTAAATYTYEFKAARGSFDDCVNGSSGSNTALTNRLAGTPGPRQTASLSTSPAAFVERLKKARGIDVVPSDGIVYHIYLWTLEHDPVGCRASKVVKREDANSDQEASISDNKHVVVTRLEENDAGGVTPVDYIYLFGDDRDEGSTVAIASSIDGQPLWTDGSSSSPAADGKNSCAYIKNVINDLWVDAQTSLVNGEFTLTEADTGFTPTSGGATDAGTNCAIPDIGWVVCPIVNFMAGANSTLYGVLQGLLVVDTEIVEADSNNLSYNAWQVMRSFANVGFVIVFLIIIFSQISSIGISNYGIKKMLPRLVIAAILVNVSFIICQVAVDVSNILGGSIVSLLDNTAIFGSTGNADDVGTIAGNILAGTLGIGAVVAGGAVAGVALSGGTVLGAAALLLPVLLAALLAIVVTVFILAARQVVIILLVVLAPLAFLAMLLPNTENLFKQWRKIFISMLLVYPMIGLLYGGSTLASKIVLGTGEPDALQAILGIIILFVPLLLTPSLLQASLKAVPALGGFASKLASRANSNLSGSAKKRLAPEFSKMLSNRAAGLSLTGKERYKKSRKDGVELERNEAGALVPKRDANGNYIKKRGGAKLDAKGNIIGPKRRTYSQLLGDRTKLTEKTIEANKAVADNNYGQRGLDGRTKMDRNIRAITDRTQTAGLDQERIGKVYTGRLKGRQLSGGSLESNITAQLEDAEGTVKVLDSKIGEEKSLRIEHGAENTAAEAMGVADMQTELTVAHRDADGNITGSSVETVDMKNLRDVSKVGFATEEATKASELRIQRGNKESGVASGSIQSQKESEAGVKVYDTQQEETFKTRQGEEEPLMKLAEQQDAADRGIATLDEEQKARLENLASGKEPLENEALEQRRQRLEELEKRKQTATEQLATFHANEEAELAKRRAPGGDLAGLTQEQERSKLEEEKAKAEQEKAFQDRQTPEGDLADLRGDIDASGVGTEAAKAQQEAALAERKKFGGDLFDDAAAAAAAKATAAAAGKRFDSTVKEMATKDTDKRALRAMLLGERPDPAATTSDGKPLYPGGASDAEYLKAVGEYDEKERQFDAAETDGLRDTLQKASTEDYIASSRIEQAEMDKKLGIDAEMQKDPDLVKKAAGVGTVDRVQASAARRLQEDRRSDVTAAEDLYQRSGLGRDENLLLQGVDINGDELFDETGKFDYHGEQDPDEVWKGYVEARKKIGKPLPDTASRDLPIPQEHRMDEIQEEALVRRTIKEGDQRANERLPDRLAKKVQKEQEKFEQWKVDNPGATDEQAEKAEEGLKTARKLQVAAIEQYSSSPAGMSPFMSSGDRGALANGTLVRTGDEQIVNTFASEKVASPDFSAKWNIEHWKAARKVFKDLAKGAKKPDDASDAEKAAVDAVLAPSGLSRTDPRYTADPDYKKQVDQAFSKEFDKQVNAPVRAAKLKKMIDDNLEKDGIKPDDENYETEYKKRWQSVADARKGLDSVDDDPAYQAVDGRAHAEIKAIRNALDTLENDGAIPPPTDKNGVPYRRPSYTNQPGVVETTNAGGIVYLEDVELADPADPSKTITAKRKYTIDAKNVTHRVDSNEGGVTIYVDSTTGEKYKLDADGNRQPI